MKKVYNIIGLIRDAQIFKGATPQEIHIAKVTGRDLDDFMDELSWEDDRWLNMNPMYLPIGTISAESEEEALQKATLKYGINASACYVEEHILIER